MKGKFSGFHSDDVLFVPGHPILDHQLNSLGIQLTDSFWRGSKVDQIQLVRGTGEVDLETSSGNSKRIVRVRLHPELKRKIEQVANGFISSQLELFFGNAVKQFDESVSRKVIDALAAASKKEVLDEFKGEVRTKLGEELSDSLNAKIEEINQEKIQSLKGLTATETSFSLVVLLDQNSRPFYCAVPAPGSNESTLVGEQKAKVPTGKTFRYEAAVLDGTTYVKFSSNNASKLVAAKNYISTLDLSESRLIDIEHRDFPGYGKLKRIEAKQDLSKVAEELKDFNVRIWKEIATCDKYKDFLIESSSTKSDPFEGEFWVFSSGESKRKFGRTPYLAKELKFAVSFTKTLHPVAVNLDSEKHKHVAKNQIEAFNEPTRDQLEQPDRNRFRVNENRIETGETIDDRQLCKWLASVSIEEIGAVSKEELLSQIKLDLGLKKVKANQWDKALDEVLAQRDAMLGNLNPETTGNQEVIV